ncbi:MAG: FHA domain-containing protein [Myxococcaceae bacterium]|nr:FHA domain-containing protein [Myxococcaceae bacterium]
MILQLKDLASQKLISVPEEGLTFGREGGDAQVQVADMGVSKRHAEIFCEGGAWFLKDLGSSNGTMLANERIADATEILPGDVFQLSKRKFEVLKVLEEGAEDDAPPEDEDPPQMTEPERKAAVRPGGKPAAAAKSAPPPAKKPSGQKMAPAGKTSEPTRGAPEADDGGGEEIGNASVGQVLAGVPKAIAYYLVNVPLMLLNPFGTIRKGIEEQPKDPMGRMELIAWALPGNVVSGAMGFIAGLIAQLITGSLSIGSLIGGLVVGAIVAVVASVVTGIIWHPLLTWLIAKLFKGESDARGRTNYFLQTQTAIIIAVLPSGLAIIVAALRARFGIPFIGLVPVLLSAVTGALSLLVFIKWMEHFNTAKWVKIVGYVFLALTALSALAGIPGALAGGGGGGTIVATGPGGDVDVGDVDDALKTQIESMKAAGATDEQIKAAEEAYKQSQAALKAAGAAGADAQKAIADAQKQAAEATKAAAEAAKAATDDAKKAADDAKKATDDAKGKKPPEAAAAKDDPKPAEKAPPPEPETPKASPPAPVPSGGGYAAWRVKFDSIEKRVTDDPTVLKGNVLKAYMELQEKSADAEAAVRKEYKKADRRTIEHLRDAELYDKSQGTVNDLYKALFGR